MKNMTVSSGVHMNWFAVAAGVLCLTLAGAVSADEKRGDRPCTADAEKLCKGVEKGEGRVKKCLKEHESEVSAACKENLGKMKEKVGEMKEACKGDKEKLCNGVKPGDGNILKCLKEHESELTAACKDEMGRSHSKK